MSSFTDPYRGLIRASCVINSIHDYRELLTRVLQITKEVMRCDAASLMLYEEATNDLSWHVALGDKADKLKEMGRLKMGQGVAGWVAENRQSALVADTSTDSRFFRGADTKTGFQTRSIVCVPLLIEQKLVGVLQALNPLHKSFFDQDDLEVFEAYGALAATAIEKIRWQESAIQQQKLLQELEIAQEIQSRFLSLRFEQAEEAFQLAFHSQPAFQIGGDFYDVQKTDDGAFAIILGDVTGKGVPAALLMAQILSEFRYRAPREKDPGTILAHLNQNLNRHSARGMFATAWCGVARPRDGTLHMLHASAGHLEPFRGSPGKAESLMIEAGFPLGLTPDVEYPSSELILAPNEFLCVYTDGISEGRNREGEEFGTERMKNLVASLEPHLSEAKDEILKSVAEFEGGAPQRDDVTFLLCGPLLQGERAAPKKKQIHYECTSCPSQMASVRSRVRDSATAFGFDEDTVSHLVLAVDEACTNIIRYAYCGSTTGRIEMDLSSVDGAWEVRLRDYGEPCDPEMMKSRELEDIRPGGLGLFFIQKAFDQVMFEPMPDKGTRLIMRKKKPTV